MSREYTLNSDLVKVKAGNRADLLEALRRLGDCDSDFNGENGSEYNWAETEEGGFESNVDYLINEVKDIEDDEECINTFIDEWMEHDKNYYADYSVQCLTDTKNRVTAISFTTISGY